MRCVKAARIQYAHGGVRCICCIHTSVEVYLMLMPNHLMACAITIYLRRRRWRKTEAVKEREMKRTRSRAKQTERETAMRILWKIAKLKADRGKAMLTLFRIFNTLSFPVSLSPLSTVSHHTLLVYTHTHTHYKALLNAILWNDVSEDEEKKSVVSIGICFKNVL